VRTSANQGNPSPKQLIRLYWLIHHCQPYRSFRGYRSRWRWIALSLPGLAAVWPSIAPRERVFESSRNSRFPRLTLPTCDLHPSLQHFLINDPTKFLELSWGLIFLELQPASRIWIRNESEPPACNNRRASHARSREQHGNELPAAIGSRCFWKRSAAARSFRNRLDRRPSIHV